MRDTKNRKKTVGEGGIDIGRVLVLGRRGGGYRRVVLETDPRVGLGSGTKTPVAVGTLVGELLFLCLCFLICKNGYSKSTGLVVKSKIKLPGESTRHLSYTAARGDDVGSVAETLQVRCCLLSESTTLERVETPCASCPLSDDQYLQHYSSLR